MAAIDITYGDGLRLSEFTSVAMDIANVQGQIDTILSKYEMML